LATLDVGALPTGACDRAIDPVGCRAGCFRDCRRPDLIEHTPATSIGQRVLAMALGYRDPNACLGAGV
jgi:hypothetical protein